MKTQQNKKNFTYPERFDGNGDVVPLPDGLVHVAILPTAQLMLHNNVRPESTEGQIMKIRGGGQVLKMRGGRTGLENERGEGRS